MSYTGLFIPQPHLSFLVVWFAQVIGSFGQPLILNNVVRPSLPPDKLLWRTGSCVASRAR